MERQVQGLIEQVLVIGQRGVPPQSSGVDHGNEPIFYLLGR
jgi:hypothetical protein